MAQDSTTVRAGSRTYFFDVKQTAEGKNYLLVTESRFKGEEQERERQTIVVFPEEAEAFARAIEKMVSKL